MANLAQAIRNDLNGIKTNHNHDGMYLLDWKYLPNDKNQSVVLVKNGIVDESGEPFDDFIDLEKQGRLTMTRLVPIPTEEQTKAVTCLLDSAELETEWEIIQATKVVKELFDSWKVAPQYAPCPFCGDTNFKTAPAGDYFSVKCLKCDAWGPIAKTHELALEAWNRRLGEGDTEE